MIRFFRQHKKLNEVEFKPRGYYEGLGYMGLVKKLKDQFTGSIREEYYPFATKSKYKEWYEQKED